MMVCGLSLKMQNDLELAADVQRSMLPGSLPTVSGYSFWAYRQPESAVGGDIYDFQMLMAAKRLSPRTCVSHSFHFHFTAR
jgi:hypothetical protein